MPFLSIENISFSYGKNDVLKGFSLGVEEGSFTTLLGSSGSGKTTLLRLISGFLEPSSGVIKIGGKTINGILPNKRQTGFVFQDYALFPHMTVFQNLSYGLKIKRHGQTSKKETAELVLKTAENLGIQNLLERFPSELSGGQQQRVALGRALVLKPSLLLMDEPLSSLDTNLRQKVRGELKEIQQRLKITTVYVTHDQEEALSLSDKIAVMEKGKLLQYGTPHEIYFEPKDKFTAEFIGRANFLGKTMVRPEWIRLEKDSVKADFFGIVESSEFLGAFTRYRISLVEKSPGGEISAGKTFVVDEPTVLSSEIRNGDRVGISFLRKAEIS